MHPHSPCISSHSLEGQEDENQNSRADSSNCQNDTPNAEANRRSHIIDFNASDPVQKATSGLGISEPNFTSPPLPHVLQLCEKGSIEKSNFAIYEEQEGADGQLDVRQLNGLTFIRKGNVTERFVRNVYLVGCIKYLVLFLFTFVPLRSTTILFSFSFALLIVYLFLLVRLRESWRTLTKKHPYVTVIMFAVPFTFEFLAYLSVGGLS